MNINNINSAGLPENRTSARVDQGKLGKPVPHGPHSASKQPAESGQPLATNISELSKRFEQIADLRPEVVEIAKAKLQNGEFNQREVVLRTAKAILGE